MTFQEQAAKAIRASGGRMTSQRSLLLNLLAGATANLSAEQLHQLACEDDPNISLPTVYRTLHTLEAARLITAHFTSKDHERKVYHVNRGQESFHFTCRSCGRVIAFQSNFINQLKQELRHQLDADILSLCICSGGLCADCREEDKMMTLDQLTANQTATVSRITGKGAIRRRLMDMGLVKGSQIEMVKAAPMGDPVDYLVRGYHLSLRKSEAQLVEIDPC